MKRPDINRAIIDQNNYVPREWQDFFFGIYDAIGVVRGTKTATADIDFASIASGGTGTGTISVMGARANDSVRLGLPAALDAGLSWDAHVSADDTVTIRATNGTAGAIDPASATYRVTVEMY